MKEEKNIESPLLGIKKENHFKTPEGYFDHLQDRIEAQIDAETTPVTTRTKVIRVLKPALSLAASFALVFLLVYYPLNKYLPELIKYENVQELSTSISEEEFLVAFVNEDDLFETLNQNEQSLHTSEDVYTYLTSEMTDFDCFNELKND